MLARVNTSARSEASVARLPTRLGIAVPLKAADERGFPLAGEMRELATIEERLGAAIRESGGRLVLVITTGGMREFISYVPSRSVGDAAAARVRSSTATHSIQHYTETDEDWGVLNAFTKPGRP